MQRAEQQTSFTGSPKTAETLVIAADALLCRQEIIRRSKAFRARNIAMTSLFMFFYSTLDLDYLFCKKQASDVSVAFQFYVLLFLLIQFRNNQDERHWNHMTSIFTRRKRLSQIPHLGKYNEKHPCSRALPKNFFLCKTKIDSSRTESPNP